MPISTPHSSEQTVRAMFRYILLVTALGFGICSLVLSPIYHVAESNVLYREEWWCYVLYYLTQEGLIDLGVFALAYPATIYAVWVGGLRRARSVLILYASLTVAKSAANFIVTSITFGSVPSFSVFFEEDLPIIGSSLLLELAQYGLVVLFITLTRRAYCRRESRLTSDALLRQGAGSSVNEAPVFPITRLVSFRNPVQCAAFLSSVLLLLGRVAMHLIYQMTLIVYNGSWDGPTVLAFDLLSDAVLSVCIYFVMILLLGQFDRRRALRENADQ